MNGAKLLRSEKEFEFIPRFMGEHSMETSTKSNLQRLSQPRQQPGKTAIGFVVVNRHA